MKRIEVTQRDFNTLHVAGKIEHGYHTAVYPNLTADEAEARYRADFTLPRGYIVQPAKYSGALDTLLPVDPRLNLLVQLGLVGIPIEGEQIDLINVIVNQVRVPKKPYIAWGSGESYRPGSVNEAISQFAPYEEGCTFLEVISYYLHEPDTFWGLTRRGYSGYAVQAAGSRLRYSGLVPGIDNFHQVRVSISQADTKFQECDILSRGKDLVILGRSA